MTKLPRTCSVENCDRKHEARGLCRSHYRKAIYVPRGEPRQRAAGLTCAVEGCGKPAKARGWCRKHHARWRRWGHPTALTPAEQRANRKCKVPDCGQRHASLGYCARHYQQAKHGQPLTFPPPPPKDLPGEEWRDVVGWEGLYAVSSFGRVKSFDRVTGKARKQPGRLLAQSTDGGGYPFVALYHKPRKRYAKVHHLVCEAYIGPKPEGAVVNHKNGIKTDNRVENLEWVSSSANNRHAYRAGLRPYLRGVDGPTTKLTEAQVRYIRAMRGTKTQRQLANELGVDKSTVQSAQVRRSWKHLDP